MARPPLERLIGTWGFEPLVDGRSTETGRATFEWIEEGAFVLERSDTEWSDPGERADVDAIGHRPGRLDR